MTLRFRKRIKLLPGVYINLGKTGVSASVGRPGATINIKPGRKPRATVGIPGTGISYSENIDQSEHASSGGIGIGGWIILALVIWAVYQVL
jgi:hypothetical protein